MPRPRRRPAQDGCRRGDTRRGGWTEGHFENHSNREGKRARPVRGRAQSRAAVAAWAVAAVAASLVAPSTAQEFRDGQLAFRLTIRDFLPSYCMLDGSYPGFTTDTYNDNRYIRMYEDGCPADADAVHMGHPDFQVRYGALGVTGYGWDLSTQIVSNSDDYGLTTIINRTAGLQAAPSGLYKPVYCSEDRCGHDDRNYYITTSETMFDEWYNDAARNRRSGMTLLLSQTGADTGVYEFNSDESAVGNSKGFFGPLDYVLEGGTEDAINVWPSTEQERRAGHKFWFTSELHTWFQFRGDEVFSFSGDDDVWVYINGQLVVDLGGVHARAQTDITLNDALAARLGLVKDEIYEFDFFHAERRTDNSNFWFTTSMYPSCTGLFSGEFTLESQVPKSFVAIEGGGSSENRVQDNLLRLTTTEDVYTSQRIFSASKQNVGSGFVATFTVRIDSDTDSDNYGFAFVLQNRDSGLDDMPVSTGAGLGFRYLSASMAVVFDAREKQVRLHHPGAADALNSPLGSATLTAYGSFAMSTSGTHDVRVQYLWNPDWIEVFIDDSLYLRERGVNLTTILGSGSAYVGFTSGTGAQPAVQEIYDFKLRTMQVNNSQTQFVPFDEQPSGVGFIVNGIPSSVRIQTYDECGRAIGFGGASSRLSGVFVRVDNDVRGLRQQSRGLQTSIAAPVNASVVDNGDGTYDLELYTDEEGVFNLYAAFGENCTLTQADDGEITLDASANTDGCWFKAFDESVSVETGTYAPTAPTYPPFTYPPTPNEVSEHLPFMYGGAALLGTLFLCVCYGQRKKTQWEQAKPFVEDGKNYLEDNRRVREVDYHDIDLNDRAARLFASRQSILRHKASKAVIQNDEAVAALQEEQRQLRSELRYAKRTRDQFSETSSANSSATALPRLATRTRRQFLPDRSSFMRPRRRASSASTDISMNEALASYNIQVDRLDGETSFADDDSARPRRVQPPPPPPPPPPIAELDDDLDDEEKSDADSLASITSSSFFARLRRGSSVFSSLRGSLLRDLPPPPPLSEIDEDEEFDGVPQEEDEFAFDDEIEVDDDEKEKEDVPDYLYNDEQHGFAGREEGEDEDDRDDERSRR